MTPDGKPQARGVVRGLAEGQSCLGTVKSFNVGKGYGFIAVPDQPGDVYFKKELVPPNLVNDVVGYTVQFTVSLKSDGKPQVQVAQFLERPPPGYTPPRSSLANKRAPSSGPMS